MYEIDYKKTRPVAIWLYICAAAVFLMALIGAVTRLTESGLSIVEWRPIMGTLPPLNEAEWQRVFDLYKKIPEYQNQHHWMGLDDFKNIYFWEWLHRFWGRMIGLIYAIPFFYFLIRGRIPKIYRPSFWGFLFLGAAQAVMGWYMVRSGLVELTDVSHYRLAAHLGLAFVIFCLLFDMALKLSVPKTESAITLAPLRRWTVSAFCIVFVTMIWGAFVAGLNAGLVYNSFPLMGAYPWPGEGLDMSPLWINLFENHAMVQFMHRLLAMVSVAVVLILVWKSRFFQMESRTSGLFGALAVMVVIQAGLGIATLLTQVALPLAVAHQAGAMLLIALLVWAHHETLPHSYSYDRKR
ncbi:MAG: COX15/CtaA family protein [Pseudomonadota bacterium]